MNMTASVGKCDRPPVSRWRPCGRLTRWRPILVLMPLALMFPVFQVRAVDIGPEWFLIDAGGQAGRKNAIPFKNFKPISDKTFVSVVLLDIKADYPVIHNDTQNRHVASTVTLAYRIDKAILPEGPLNIEPCWNCWWLTALPAPKRKTLLKYLAIPDGVVGSSGKIPLPGTGVFSATLPMTQLREKPLVSGIYGILGINYMGYLAPENAKGVKSAYPVRKNWGQQESFIEKMTVLLVDLSAYRLNLEPDVFTAGEPLRIKLTLTDASGATWPVPNARVLASVMDADGKTRDVPLVQRWLDDTTTMVFRLPTEWFVSERLNAADTPLVVTATVNLGLPSGEKKSITLMRAMPATQIRNPNIEIRNKSE